MPEIPVLGQSGQNNNPLLVLAQAIATTNSILTRMEVNIRPTPHFTHEYTCQIVNDELQGRVWGTFCIACSHEAGNYVYPCAVRADEPVKLPAFFTIDGVFSPDELGRMRRVNDPL
jgi:hypothetical protein